MAANLEKLVEELSTLSVLEAAELVKAWKRSGAFPLLLRWPWLLPAAAAAAAEPVEEKTEFDVIIKDPGAKKIDVIKVIRQLTSLGLGEAKTLAETAGGKVLDGCWQGCRQWTPRRSSKKPAQPSSSSNSVSFTEASKRRLSRVAFWFSWAN